MASSGTCSAVCIAGMNTGAIAVRYGGITISFAGSFAIGMSRVACLSTRLRGHLYMANSRNGCASAINRFTNRPMRFNATFSTNGMGIVRRIGRNGGNGIFGIRGNGNILSS